MTSTRPERITLIGGGLVGSLLALLLARRGYRVDLYERRADPQSGGVVGGRSINLALSDRGLRALSLAGIAAEVEAVAIPMRGRTMHAVDGSLAFQPYGMSGEAIRSVSRGGLNTTLLGLARAHSNVRVHFQHRCTGIDLKAGHTTFETPAGTVSAGADLVLATDGAFSAIRQEMQKQDRFDFSQSYLSHGYKELCIPAGPDGAFLLEKHALHIWPRNEFMLIALPNTDGSFTCTLFFALDGSANSFEALPTVDAARGFFARVFPDALALMPSFNEDWERNPTSSLCTMRCFPWSAQRRVLLLGDAAHAIVPFFGQGMNAGFEDCAVLMELLDQTALGDRDDWAHVMPTFERTRKPDTDAIAELALENFVEMREKVAQPAFLLRKKIEAHLARLCPQKVAPVYTMVTFSPGLSYSEALRRGRAQDRVLDRAEVLPGIAEALATGAHDAALRALVSEHL